MTREEIEKISVSKPYRFESHFEKIWYEVGCIDGLKAADAEPNLESLWHDVSEEPQYDLELIIYKYKDNFWLINKHNTIRFHGSWKNFVSDEQVIQWAYAKDLFPKGGKK